MKTTIFRYILSAFLLTSFSATEAQILKNIKKKIEKKTEETIDNILNGEAEPQSKQSDNSTSNKKTSNKVGPFQNLQVMEYDYARGEEIIFTDDFSADSLGLMASKWTSNGNGTVRKVDIVDGKWLELFDDNTYKIKQLVKLPEAFTIEFDLLTTSDDKGKFVVDFGFDYQKGIGQHYYLAYQNPVNIQASYWFNKFDFASKEVLPKKRSEVSANMSYFINDVMKVKIKVQGDKMNVYANDFKLLDTEMIDPMTKKYFYIALNNDDPSAKVYISNFRIDKIID